MFIKVLNQREKFYCYCKKCGNLAIQWYCNCTINWIENNLDLFKMSLPIGPKCNCGRQMTVCSKEWYDYGIKNGFTENEKRSGCYI